VCESTQSCSQGLNISNAVHECLHSLKLHGRQPRRRFSKKPSLHFLITIPSPSPEINNNSYNMIDTIKSGSSKRYQLRDYTKQRRPSFSSKNASQVAPVPNNKSSDLLCPTFRSTLDKFDNDYLENMSNDGSSDDLSIVSEPPVMVEFELKFPPQSQRRQSSPRSEREEKRVQTSIFRKFHRISARSAKAFMKSERGHASTSSFDF